MILRYGAKLHSYIMYKYYIIIINISLIIYKEWSILFIACHFSLIDSIEKYLLLFILCQYISIEISWPVIN